MVKYNRKIERNEIGKDLTIHKKEIPSEVNTEKTVESYQYLNIGFYIITPILTGVIVGLFLDNRLQTNHTFFLICLLVGVAGTFYNLFKLTNLK